MRSHVVSVVPPAKTLNLTVLPPCSPEVIEWATAAFSVNGRSPIRTRRQNWIRAMAAVGATAPVEVGRHERPLWVEGV